MKFTKKLIVTVLTLMIVTTTLPTNVHAITFVYLFSSTTGEVINVAPAQSGGYFLEIEREYGVSRFYVSQDTFVLGDAPSKGDIITGYFGSIALSGFEGVVLEMEQIAFGQYDVLMEYTPWFDENETSVGTFHVDFNRNFHSTPFSTGDTISAYHNPWGTPYIFDMPQYNAVFIVNGNYDVYVGGLTDNVVSNRIRGLSGDEGIELEITDETLILNSNGEPFTGELTDHTHIAVVFNDTGIDKMVVIWQLTEMPSSWAIEQVTTAVNMNLVPSNLQSNFTAPITRAEFSALAVNMYESVNGEITGRTTFTDTNDINVEKAAYIGIISGIGNNRFDPDATLN